MVFLLKANRVIKFAGGNGKRFLSLQSEDSVVLSKKHGGEDAGIVELSLNSDPKALNVLSTPLVNGIIDTLASLKQDEDLRVLIIKSNTKKAFSAGMNVKEGAFGSLVHLCHQMILDIINFPRPTISAIDGVALGGGLEVAIACDVIVGSDNMRAGLVESKLGLIPGGGGHYNLAALVGPKRAKEIIFTAEMLNGQTCYDIGLIQHLVKQNEASDAAYLKAMDIARKIKAQAPLALEHSKVLVNSAHSLDFPNAYAKELFAFLSLEATEDSKIGLQHFFNKEKGAPAFKAK